MKLKLNKHIICLVLIFSILVFSSISSINPSYAISLSDIDNHWARSYIQTVSDFNAINGYPDGSFKPNDNIKRIEFISLIVKSQGLQVRNLRQGEFWGMPYIESALENNFIRFFEYGSMTEVAFSKYISRQEMASIVVNAYIKSGGRIDPLAFNAATAMLSDLDTVSPDYISNAISSVALEFILGYPDGTFSPMKNATRSEAAVVSYRLLNKQGIIPDGYLPINVIVSKNNLEQGDLLDITVHHLSEGTEVSLNQDLYSNFKWYKSDNTLKGYIPTNYNTKPGVYLLKFTDSKTKNIVTKVIDIAARDFRVQHLKIDTTIESSTRTEEANAEYRKYFNPSREVSSQTRYYSEPFILPVKGRISTEFGESRTVNGSLTSYRHAGIDIAAPLNTNILATNRGKVTLAMPLILTGNSIVIDHGEGLFSVYFHLEKLNVTQGDIVERGQIIGTVGSTGFSTGPHLHFTMSHYNINLEPGYFIYGESITKNNYLELMK